MEKVKVSKEVAEAIEVLRQDGYTDAQIVYGVESDNLGKPLNSYFYVDGRNTDMLLQALVNGYEVEKTPEEKLAESYHYNYIDEGGDGENRAFAAGIRYALTTLGIKIEGVNA